MRGLAGIFGDAARNTLGIYAVTQTHKMRTYTGLAGKACHFTGTQENEHRVTG